MCIDILCRGLEHQCIWVSVEGPGINPPTDIERQLTFGGIKSYTWIFDRVGFSVPTLELFKDRLYVHKPNEGNEINSPLDLRTKWSFWSFT